jgi:hypothetical protein
MTVNSANDALKILHEAQTFPKWSRSLFVCLGCASDLLVIFVGRERNHLRRSAFNVEFTEDVSKVGFDGGLRDA